MSDQKAVAMLKDCENDFSKKAKECETNVEVQAVLSRIKFTRLLLQSLLLLYPTKTFSPNETEMSEIVKLLTGAVDVIPTIKKTLDKGTQPDKESKKYMSPWHSKWHILVFHDTL